jgi:NAD(P)-dependent dehydrogenase (short-subunit alcohol dehydrogenase family)
VDRSCGTGEYVVSGALSGAVALVTGTRTDVGRRVTSELARRGAHVLIGTADADLVLVEQIREAGGTADAVVGAWDDENEVSALATSAMDVAGGRIDILVSHVGAFDPEDRPLDVDRVFAANIQLPDLLLAGVTPRMAADGIAITVWSADLHASRVHDATMAALQLISRSWALRNADAGRARVELVEPATGHETPAQLAERVIELVVGGRERGGKPAGATTAT